MMIKGGKVRIRKEWGFGTVGGLLAASIALSNASPAHGAFVDGNALYAECTATKDDATYFSKASRCMGYVLGVYDDMMFVLQAQYGKGDCTPNRITAGQITDIVIKYIRDNPQERHFSGALLVRVALFEAFPACVVSSE